MLNKNKTKSKLPQNKVLHMTQLPSITNIYINISRRQIYANDINWKTGCQSSINDLVPLAFVVFLTLMKCYSSDSVLLKISTISPSLSFRNTCWRCHLVTKEVKIIYVTYNCMCVFIRIGMSFITRYVYTYDYLLNEVKSWYLFMRASLVEFV